MNSDIKTVTNNQFTYFEEDNCIRLEGVFSSDELRSVANVMDRRFKLYIEPKRIKKINIAGFTSKDVKVFYEKSYDNDGYDYMFTIVHDGTPHDFYYGQYNSDGSPTSWWPANGFEEFVPKRFEEICENKYKFLGSKEEALKYLHECGFLTQELCR